MRPHPSPNPNPNVPPKEEEAVKRTSQEIAYMKTHCSKQPATAIKKSLGLVKAFRW